MTDYTKLVAALRCKELKGIACPDCYERECAANSGKGLYCRVPQLLDDAAAAIEALQAQLLKEAHWVAVDNGCGVCSNCNRQDRIDSIATHCRYCGAKMEVQDG